MALHCVATLVLVPTGLAREGIAEPGAVVVTPLPQGTDVVAELQALADQHRGERVVVPVDPEHLAAVFDHLGRAPRTVDGGAGEVRLEIGDDGWRLPPVRE